MSLVALNNFRLFQSKKILKILFFTNQIISKNFFSAKSSPLPESYLSPERVKVRERGRGKGDGEKKFKKLYEKNKSLESFFVPSKDEMSFSVSSKEHRDGQHHAKTRELNTKKKSFLELKEIWKHVTPNFFNNMYNKTLNIPRYLMKFT
nr:hypothetical protein [Trentepohlia sp. YN1317]